MSPRWAELRAVDRLQIAYLAGLAALAAARHPRPLPLLLAIGAMAGAIVVAAHLAPRSPRMALARDFLPVLLVIAAFNVSGPVIAAANPMRWDPLLADLDRELFGTLAERWIGFLGRPAWLTDAASLAYASYYGIPIAMGVSLYRSGRRREFDHFAFVTVATFLASYVCYLLVPAYGPRVPAPAEALQLGGGATSEALRRFLRAAEVNQLDAFPSGHTALALVWLGLGWRLFPRGRLVLAALVAGIVFSTVYLSLHYVIDLVAGAALAAAMPFVCPVLERWLTPRAASDGAAALSFHR